MDPKNPTPPVVEQQIEPAVPTRRGMVLIMVLGIIVVLVVLSSIMASRHGGQRRDNGPVQEITPVNPRAVTAFGSDQDARAAAEANRMSSNPSGAGPETMAQENGDRPAQGRTNGGAVQRSGGSTSSVRKNRNLVVIDFSKEEDSGIAQSIGHPAAATTTAEPPAGAEAQQVKANPEDPMQGEHFDLWTGKLYRVYESTVLEGVVINRVDGAQAGPVVMMMTKDLYSHDNLHLLLPAGTRIVGTVKSVSGEQQRKLFVSFDHAICPDGFELNFDKFLALDQMGTSGLATKVNHQYLQAFAAAMAVGGIGGLAQVGNNGSVFNPQTEVITGMSQETGMEGEEILNHFLNRLPIITLKEGSRAEVYIGVPMEIPSNDEHRMDPNI